MARQAVKTATKQATTKSRGAAPAKAKTTNQPKAKSAKAAAPRSTPPKAIAKSTGKKPASAAPTAASTSAQSKATKPTGAGKRGRPARPAPAAPDTPLKQRFAALQTATREITTMKRAISKNFFDVGVILNQIRDNRLYEVKGYGSFESFVERELDLNKVICMRSARIAQALDRDQAIEAGLDRSAAAVAALDGEFVQSAVAASSAGVPLVPLHKQ